MIGNGYWATGISLRWSNRHGGMWGATVNYYDDGFCSDDPDNSQISTEGELRTRYLVRDGSNADALTVVIDTIVADAARLGINWRETCGSAQLYYEGDGEDADWPPPPDWKEMLDEQARRLTRQFANRPEPVRWASPYRRTETVACKVLRGEVIQPDRRALS